MKNKSIKLFTLNTWLLPFGFSKDNEKRLTELINFLSISDYSIITLQEVWLNKYIEIIENSALKKKYNFFYTRNKLFNHSGLLTIIRGDIQIKRNKTIFFRNVTGNRIEELLAKKGFQIIDIVLKEQDFRIINTHLYAAKLEKEKRITKKQMNILSDYLKANSIICGDLNLEQFEIQESFSNWQLGKRDNYTINSKNFYQNIRNIKIEKKIDYIITNSNLIDIKEEIMIQKDLSDHFGIETKFNY